MFHYMLTPLDQHFDLGFGAVADSFRDAAESIQHAPQEHRGLNEHLPVSFLYRHAIELYLKSAIIIFHKKFRLPYGDVPCTAEPHVLIGGRWKPMYQVHSLNELYPYFRRLFVDHASYLERNTKTDWSFSPELDRWIADVEGQDSTSTFFRYPVTKHRDKDKEKSVIKPDSHLNIMSRMGPGQKPQKAFFVLNEHDEVTQAFYHDDKGAKTTIDTLQRTCEQLYGCHAALRGELTGGW